MYFSFFVTKLTRISVMCNFMKEYLQKQALQINFQTFAFCNIPVSICWQGLKRRLTSGPAKFPENVCKTEKICHAVNGDL